MAKSRIKAASKRSIFAREYAIHRNGTKAAIAAGFARNSAAQTASKLLRKTDVQEEITRITRASLDRLDITLDKVLQETAKVAYADMGNYLTFDESGNPKLDFRKICDEIGPSEGQNDAFRVVLKAKSIHSAAIQEYCERTWYEGRGEDKKQVKEVKLKLNSGKVAALENLRRHLTGDLPEGTDDKHLSEEEITTELDRLIREQGYVRAKETIN